MRADSDPLLPPPPPPLRVDMVAVVRGPKRLGFTLGRPLSAGLGRKGAGHNQDGVWSTLLEPRSGFGANYLKLE